MTPELISQIILAILGLVGGTGGILSFVIQYKTSKRDDNTSTSEEWHKLYTTMAERLKAQESLNSELRHEIDKLQVKMNDLTIELAGYKIYDAYISECELYISELLNKLQPSVSADVYESILKKRPKHNINDTRKTRSK